MQCLLFIFFILRIQFECGKIQTRKNPITDTFHAVHKAVFSLLWFLVWYAQTVRIRVVFKWDICEWFLILYYCSPSYPLWFNDHFAHTRSAYHQSHGLSTRFLRFFWTSFWYYSDQLYVLYGLMLNVNLPIVNILFTQHNKSIITIIKIATIMIIITMISYRNICCLIKQTV